MWWNHICRENLLHITLPGRCAGGGGGDGGGGGGGGALEVPPTIAGWGGDGVGVTESEVTSGNFASVIGSRVVTR